MHIDGSQRLRIGVSGWTRPDWEPLWPEAGDERRLALLARTFGCLEIDTTRFATPALRTVQRWNTALAAADAVGVAAAPATDQSPSRACRALVEVPATLLDANAPLEEPVARLVLALRPLVRARRLGALVARFDVQFLYGPAELRRLGRLASALAPLPLVLEARHPSWWDPRALDALRGVGVSLAHVDVASDWRRIPERHAPTGPIGVLRLVGRGASAQDASAAHSGLGPEVSDFRYPPPLVGRFAQRARAIAREVDECFVVAANVTRGQALATAFELRWLCEARGPLTPWPKLRATFPDLAALESAPPPL
ncbi:MAG: DUF72 domain-containing protein [Planctomycetota bacterium]